MRYHLGAHGDDDHDVCNSCGCGGIWYTRQTKDLVACPCGFESHHPHGEYSPMVKATVCGTVYPGSIPGTRPCRDHKVPSNQLDPLIETCRG